VPTLNSLLHADQDTADTALVAIYDYDRVTCLGHLIRRGKSGVEAFDADTKTLGTYPDIDTAAAACWRRARGQA
jgi:hypothetical protein